MNTNYKILSDGSCDLSWNILPSEQIIPFSISLDGLNYYKEKIEKNIEEFYEELPGIYPKTSVPSVTDFTDKFVKFMEEGSDIICFTISSHLSSSYQSARIAADLMREKYPEQKVYIIDSLHATASLGLIIRQALKMQDEGKNLEQILDYAESATQVGGVNFVVGDLSYLSKGGRLGRVALQTGKTLQLLPLISFTKGKNSVKGMARGQKSLAKKLLKLTNEYIESENINKEDLVFTVGYSDKDSKIQSKQLEELVIKEFGDKQVLDMIQIGATITAHTGPGTFGVGFTLKGVR